MNPQKYFYYAPEIIKAKQNAAPLVALETTVLTHGLPYPQNVQLARDMETEVRTHGATPATIGILDGLIHIGMDADQIERMIHAKKLRKISRRDFAPAIARKESGGTTVAGTLIAAHAAGIPVFATGGIGGVHRSPAYDISADLPELSRTPVIVVCAGAKSILDLPATLEYLETAGVPVVGYQADEFPAFFAASSGLPVSVRADSPEEVAAIADAHWSLGIGSALLVVAPPPSESALPAGDVEKAIAQALLEAEQQQVRGQAVTPFLLERVSVLTGKESLETNLALLLNNARIAAQISAAYMRLKNLPLRV